MGLKADGWKKTLQSFGQQVSTDAQMLSEDHLQEVGVLEDGNIILHRLTWGEHTETLHDLEINICNRLRKWLYDPKTFNRNRVSLICWCFDYDAPVIKQIEQKKRSRNSQQYADEHIIGMWTSGELERMFDPVNSRYTRIDFNQLKDTRPLFPYLVKYVSDFLRLRFSHEMVLKPGDPSFTLRVCSSVAEVTVMLEPSRNCGVEHWLPIDTTATTGSTPAPPMGRCVSSTRRYSFSRDPLFRRSYSFTKPLPGEAEVNLVYLCREHYLNDGLRHFFVPCVDTDIIPLFLLNHRQMIPEAQVHILLDEGTSKYRKEEFIMDVQGVARELTRWFTEHMPTVKDPVLFMCCWMVLTGTDYVETISGLDAEKLIKFLSKQGNKLMQQQFTNPTEEQLFFTDPTTGNTVFSEHLVYRLILCYHSHYPESIQGKAEFQALLKKYPPQTIEALKAMTKDKRKRPHIPDTSDEVIAQIRRASYNVHYWEKAARGEPYLDAFTCAGPGQAPLFGYFFDQNNEVQASNIVARS